MLRAVASGSASGATLLKALGNTVAGIANVETNVLQYQLVAGQWQTNGIIRIRLTAAKSGAVDAGSLTVRIGTAGTTADTAITGLSALSILSATARTGGFEFDIKLESATSAIKVGNMAANSSGYQGSTTSAQAAATTISSAAANALYVSVNLASAGATDTVTVYTGSISLVAP